MATAPAAPRRALLREVLISAWALPWFVLGFTVGAALHGLAWVKATVELGFEAAGKRWPHAR